MYLLDSNIFINAKNRAYGMDFCPAFWDWLLLEHSRGFLGSIDAVRDELLKGQDELSGWVKTLPPGFFSQLPPSGEDALKRIMTHLAAQHYSQDELAFFCSGADVYLIAHAMAGNHVVVTREKASLGSKKIKIPNVCQDFGIQYCSIYDVIRASNARFVLES